MKYAMESKLPFDTTLNLHDLGVSAFHGKNATQGKLAAFLEAIKQGKVCPGSVLVVESLDRLSRNQIGKALTLFLNILESDIKIVTLTPRDEFSKESTDDLVKIIYALVIMSRAYEESATKSERLTSAWKEKRAAIWKTKPDDKAKRDATGKAILTAQCPAWFDKKKAKEDRILEVIPEAKETIRLIFDLKLKGISTYAIEQKLNVSAPWTPPAMSKRKTSGWRTSYIKKILTNRAVIGEYQPHRKVAGKRYPEGEPEPNYFPAIVKPEVFHAVQKLFAANKGKGGRNGKVSNLLTHLVTCAYCGGPMQFEDKGESPKGAKYLACYNGKRGVKCKSYRVRYNEAETLVLDNCRRLRPEQVLPQPDEQVELCQTLRQRLDGKEGELVDINQRIDNLFAQVERTKEPAIRDRHETRITELTAQRPKVEEEVRQIQQELHEAERGMQSFKEWKRNFEALQTSLDRPDVRLRLQLHLRNLISNIKVFSVGHLREHDVDSQEEGDTVGEYLRDIMDQCDLRKDQVFRKFIRDVLKRRMSKEGRFLRITFKSGAVVNLVPDGSLASGMTLRKDRKRWAFVEPSLNRQWLEYEALHRQSEQKQRRVKLVTT